MLSIPLQVKARKKAALRSRVLAVLMLILMVVIFAIVFGNAIDRSIDNQNRMLCESAKVSGNQEYQLKCKVYYTTGSIKELR